MSQPFPPAVESRHDVTNVTVEQRRSEGIPGFDQRLRVAIGDDSTAVTPEAATSTTNAAEAARPAFMAIRRRGARVNLKRIKALLTIRHFVWNSLKVRARD